LKLKHGGEEVCTECSGNGFITTTGTKECMVCNESGYMVEIVDITSLERECKKCEGTGEVLSRKKCDSCSGRGMTKCDRCRGKGHLYHRAIVCPECRRTGETQCGRCEGTGKIEVHSSCEACHGSGLVDVGKYTERIVKAAVPGSGIAERDEDIP